MDRSAARRSVGFALIAPALWVLAMTTYAAVGPGFSADFRVHMLVGLSIVALFVLGPLVLALATLNWIVRRFAGIWVVVLFFGTASKGAAQGFGALADIGIIALCLCIVGSALYFLSRPVVRAACGDDYDFLNPRDVFSLYSFRRKQLAA